MSTTLTRATPGTLAEVVDIILDKGLVIDAYVRVSLVGIELLTIDARIVVASVDTYLHFAEVANRLDLRARGDEDDADLQELMSGLGGGMARTQASQAVEGGAETLRDKARSLLPSDDDSDGQRAREQEAEEGSSR